MEEGHTVPALYEELPPCDASPAVLIKVDLMMLLLRNQHVSIRWHMKVLPGLTTAAAWFRHLIRDCNSLFVAAFLRAHNYRVCSSCDNLGSGSLSSCLTESIRIPR